MKVLGRCRLTSIGVISRWYFVRLISVKYECTKSALKFSACVTIRDEKFSKLKNIPQ